MIILYKMTKISQFLDKPKNSHNLDNIICEMHLFYKYFDRLWHRPICFNKNVVTEDVSLITKK